MNTEIFYSAAVIASIAGLYLLWVFGFQPLFVDEFRDSLFAIRDQLYEAAQAGRLAPEHSAYRSLERLLNGLIRFAHMFNLSFLLVNDLEWSRRGIQDDPQRVISDAISEVKDKAMRAELLEMERLIRSLVGKQMMRASLPMIILSRVVAPLTQKDENRRAVKAFEREAYNAYPVEHGGTPIAAMAH